MLKKKMMTVILCVAMIAMLMPTTVIAGRPQGQNKPGIFKITIGETGDSVVCGVLTVKTLVDDWVYNEVSSVHDWQANIEWPYDVRASFTCPTATIVLPIEGYYDHQEIRLNMLRHRWELGQFNYWAITLEWTSVEDLDNDGLADGTYSLYCMVPRWNLRGQFVDTGLGKWIIDYSGWTFSLHHTETWVTYEPVGGGGKTKPVSHSQIHTVWQDVLPQFTVTAERLS